MLAIAGGLGLVARAVVDDRTGLVMIGVAPRLGGSRFASGNLCNHTWFCLCIARYFFTRQIGVRSKDCSGMISPKTQI